jgi:excisionase family DNA binding protein
MAKERLMTAREVASYLRCSVSTVRRMVLRGRVPHYRLGRLVRFRRSEIDAWLAVHQGGEQVLEAMPSISNPDQLSLFGPDDDRPPGSLADGQ